MKKAASIGIIGGADGPTAVFFTHKWKHRMALPLIIAAAAAGITIITVIYRKQK